MTAQRGIRAWSSAEWLAEATAWIDRGLAANGLERVGDVEQTRVRAWATVARVPTGAGPVWFKAAAEATAFEVPLYEVLVEVQPDWVLSPLASDPERGWLLLPDGGPTLGDRTEGADSARELAQVLAAYGRFQRSLAGEVDRMLAAGVPDMRPQRMPERFEEALAAAEGSDRLHHIASQVADWSARLAESPLRPCLDHNDLHPWNVLGDAAQPRLYDWGDSVIAHPLASALVPLRFMNGVLNASVLVAARDGYLDAFSDLASIDQLREELVIACQLAKIARSLTWERALRSSREQGVAIEPDLAEAPLHWLTELLTEN